MSGDNEVGLGRPPRRIRWKKHESGKGGRRSARRVATTAEIIDKLLRAPVDITENGGTRRVTKLEAIVLQLWLRELDGDPRALATRLKYQELGQQHPQRATEITFGDSPYTQDSGCASPSETRDDGQV
jgi:hypothetical protein